MLLLRKRVERPGHVLMALAQWCRAYQASRRPLVAKKGRCFFCRGGGERVALFSNSRKEYFFCIFVGSKKSSPRSFAIIVRVVKAASGEGRILSDRRQGGWLAATKDNNGVRSHPFAKRNEVGVGFPNIQVGATNEVHSFFPSSTSLPLRSYGISSFPSYFPPLLPTPRFLPPLRNWRLGIGGGSVSRLPLLTHAAKQLVFLSSRSVPYMQTNAPTVRGR